MAQNKRVALTLPAEVDAILSELSVLMSTPKTALITEILVDSLPTFQMVLTAVRQSKEGQKQLAVQTAEKFLQDVSFTLNQTHMDLGVLKERHGK